MKGLECQDTEFGLYPKSQGHQGKPQSQGVIVIPTAQTPSRLEEWGRLWQPSAERESLGEVALLGTESCNFSHWKPQARFLVNGKWCQQGQRLLPAAERRGRNTSPTPLLCTQSYCSWVHLPFGRQHDTMGETETQGWPSCSKAARTRCSPFPPPVALSAQTMQRNRN